jgi:hypothetical protein
MGRVGQLDTSGLTREQQRSFRWLQVGWYGADVCIALMALGILLRGDHTAAVALFVYVLVSVPLAYVFIRTRRKQLLAANMQKANDDEKMAR